MLSYEFLFDIALILMSTKLLGLLTKKIQLPQVSGYEKSHSLLKIA